MADHKELNSVPQFLWHHKCHQVWANERLCFWQLGFSPTYNVVEIAARIKVVMQDYGICSFAIYEMTGNYDLLLRIWLPPSVTSEDFQVNLKKKLKDVHLHYLDPFLVNTILNHWIWDRNGIEPMRVPPDNILKKRLDDAEIRRINDGKISMEEFTYFSSKNLIATFQPTNGIKFEVVIPPSPNITVYARDHLIQLLRGILARAQSILEISLYSGAGFAEFLLMGKISPENFHLLDSQLLQPINEIGIGNLFGIRTYTHIVVNAPSDTRSLQDRLPPFDAVLFANDERPLSEYLKRPEEEKLEFKGSVFTDWKAVLSTGRPDCINEKLLPEVLRAIVGQLNGKGGKVIIGVLELKRFTDTLAQERLKQFPSLGDYAICGVNNDFGEKDWDHFERKFQQLINSRIIPSPHVWVSIKREVFDVKDVCIVSVRPPTSDWFYIKDDPNFFVRHGNATRQLSGPEADDYRRHDSR